MQFIFGPVLGGLSDRFGRRPVLLISLVVMTADYLVMAMVSSIWLLLIGRLVGGYNSSHTINRCRIYGRYFEALKKKLLILALSAQHLVWDLLLDL